MTVTVFKIWVLQGGSEIIFPNLKNLSCVHKKNVKSPPHPTHHVHPKLKSWIYYEHFLYFIGLCNLLYSVILNVLLHRNTFATVINYVYYCTIGNMFFNNKYHH